MGLSTSFFFFQAEDGIRDRSPSRGLGDVYKRQGIQPPVIKVGNLSAKRDFTDVRDVVKAYALLVMNGRRGETYNVGTGKAVSIQDILDRIVSMSECEIKVEVDPAKLRPVDVPIIEPDITKIVGEVGWHPEIDLNETLKETLTYWRSK